MSVLSPLVSGQPIDIHILNEYDNKPHIIKNAVFTGYKKCGELMYYFLPFGNMVLHIPIANISRIDFESKKDGKKYQIKPALTLHLNDKN